MINLPNARATRLAFKMASWAEGNLARVALYPDGMMFATTGIAALASSDAHDAEIGNPIFVSPPKRVSIAANAESFALDTERGILIEYRSRSEAEHDVEIETGLKFPPVHNVLPGHMAEDAQAEVFFDSIIAGKIASDYGLKRGVWRRGKIENRVYLDGVDETDIVILAGIRSGQ